MSAMLAASASPKRADRAVHASRPPDDTEACPETPPEPWDTAIDDYGTGKELTERAVEETQPTAPRSGGFLLSSGCCQSGACDYG